MQTCMWEVSIIEIDICYKIKNAYYNMLNEFVASVIIVVLIWCGAVEVFVQFAFKNLKHSHHNKKMPIRVWCVYRINIMNI